MWKDENVIWFVREKKTVGENYYELKKLLKCQERNKVFHVYCE